MSAVALALVGMGHEVSGSDIRESPILDHLRQTGVTVTIGHDPAVVVNCDAVTSSPAIPADNSEVAAARSRNIFLTRAEILASICAVRPTIGIAGTHGKTTTSALLVRVMQECGLQPSFIVGGELIDEQTSARWSDGPWTIVEADESDGTHLHLPLAATILTNVDVDHLDHFADFEAIVESFCRYLLGVQGVSVVCLDDAGCQRLLEDPRLAGHPGVITYGASEQAQVRFSDVVVTKSRTRFTVHLPVDLSISASLDGVDERKFEVETSLRGLHNVANITGVIALAHAIGVSLTGAVAAVGSFSGVGRRFQIMGRENGVTFVDDYAHLPREIEAVLEAARSSDEGWKRVVAVFQPNRFNRMAVLAPAYADCFVSADVVVITDIYASGTKKIDGVTGHLVIDAIRTAHPDIDVRWAPQRDTLAEVVAPILESGDLCISMGCGDIETLPLEILDIFREAHGID
jgi:UDP-N-acetylmuramate--alanine ligase